MEASYQGVRFTNDRRNPIPNLRSPVSRARQRRKLDPLRSINQPHADARPHNSDLEARIAAHELASRMQTEAPKAVDLSGESSLASCSLLRGVNVLEIGAERVCSLHPERPAGAVQLAGVASVQEDTPALGGEAFGEGEPDSAVRAGDEGRRSGR